MRKIVVAIYIIIGMLAVVSCAKQGYPSGGPSDKTPPVVLSTLPANESLNFADNSFFIAFDEYVVVKDADNNILVSPPMKTKPSYSTKGRGIRVDIKDSLQPNTTYLFQFKNAIADFNEGNLLPSFEYVFSTGSSIDSMQLKGRVLDALTGAPRKEVVSVMLYKIEGAVDDSVVAKENPLYVTRCDDKGNFEFHYIQPGRYKVLALEDGDKNLRLGNVEAVAFADSLWTAVATRSKEADSSANDSAKVQKAPADAVLLMSEPTTEVQRIIFSEFRTKGLALVATLHPLQAPSITPLCDSLHWRLNAKGDSIQLWTVAEGVDSMKFVLNDPSGIQDTLRLRYRPSKKMGAAAANQTMPLARVSVGSQMAFYDTVRLIFANPITACQPDAMVLVTDLGDSSMRQCGLTLEADGLSAKVLYGVQPGHKYNFLFAKGLFTDIYGTKTDSLMLTTETTTAADYGNLALNVSSDWQNLIVELLDEKDGVVRRVVVYEPKTTVRFEHLKEGKYRVRAIVDANGDGQWTPGDYWQRLQPEKVFYFGKTMDLRKNWDFEENWTID